MSRKILPETPESDFGFNDALSEAVSEFSAEEPNSLKWRRQVTAEAINQAAEVVGYTSREPSSKFRKEPEDQVLIRAQASVIEEFKAFGKSQEPKWPHGYVLQRAMSALRRELARQDADSTT